MHPIGSRGISMVELLVAVSIMGILTLATSDLMSNLFTLQTNNTAKSILQDIRTEIAYGMQRPNFCARLFGNATQAIDPTLNTPTDVNIFRADDATLYVAGNPGAGQNNFGSGARITNVRIVPMAPTAPSTEGGFKVLVARLEIAGQIRSGNDATAVSITPIPVTLKLTDSTNIISSCSRLNPDLLAPIPLPNCDPEERFMLWDDPDISIPPVWTCRPI